MKNIKLKIIAGKFKNRTIVSYSNETRETSSMVRGAVFNMLFHVDGIGLDLFAGSGAYGIEGLSRGLKKVYFNDRDSLAIRSIKENIQTLKIDDQVILTQKNYQDAIKYYESIGIKFDYIFLDPPYHMTDIDLVFTEIESISNKDAKVIFEVVKETQFNPSYQCFLLIKEKVHGIKKIGIFQFNNDSK